MFEKLTKLTNENHAFLIGAIAVLAIGFYGYGCQSSVRGIIDPEQKLTRAELQTEVDYLLAQAQNRLDELDRQDEIKLLIFEQAALFTQTGTINPIGLLTTAISVVAVGSALDQRRKKKELEKNQA